MKIKGKLLLLAFLFFHLRCQGPVVEQEQSKQEPTPFPQRIKVRLRTSEKARLCGQVFALGYTWDGFSQYDVNRRFEGIGGDYTLMITKNFFYQTENVKGAFDLTRRLFIDFVFSDSLNYVVSLCVNFEVKDDRKLKTRICYSQADLQRIVLSFPQKLNLYCLSTGRDIDPDSSEIGKLGFRLEVNEGEYKSHSAYYKDLTNKLALLAYVYLLDQNLRGNYSAIRFKYYSKGEPRLLDSIEYKETDTLFTNFKLRFIEKASAYNSPPVKPAITSAINLP
jgi:hypothetical protein